jgi:Spy/CpxP family protein refolding chaperone
MTVVTAKRARLTGMLMLLIMFSVGALVGAATMHVVEGDEVPNRSRTVERERPSLFELLDLTPAQQAQVDVIMERRRKEMDAFWMEHRPRLHAITDSARAEIRRVLTPEQQQIEERFRAERRKHHGRSEAKNDARK